MLWTLWRFSIWAYKRRRSWLTHRSWGVYCSRCYLPVNLISLFEVHTTKRRWCFSFLVLEELCDFRYEWQMVWPSLWQYFRVKENISHHAFFCRSYSRYFESTKTRKDVEYFSIFVFIWHKLEVDFFRPPLFRQLIEEYDCAWVFNFNLCC